jgi:alpha-L-fucosidase
MENAQVMNHQDVPAPEPFGPIPSPRQLSWHTMEFYGFLHFTVNTFTDREWGYGDESPEVFVPTDFDAHQIAQVAVEGGMTGLILTCKHHDGFCLWPSRFTEHSVKQSPWRNGRGDVVREVAEACRTHGLKFGVYLSPWDRNHPEYGQPAYIRYYREQLQELLTNYGPLFEVWFDGANGGDGYYGGKRERREIDRKTYYEWETTWQMVRTWQPEACIFSDAGPDVRWVGNENGIAGDPCWHTLNRTEFSPGLSDAEALNRGQRPGTHWLPAECDVSIRPGWFYHASENSKVRSPSNLLDLYFHSVGRGASLLLNLPPDPHGRIYEADVAALAGLRQLLNAIFATNLIAGARVSASHTRGQSQRFGPENLVDGCRDTYWANDNDVRTAEVVFEFSRLVTFNVVNLQEYLPLGQRVERFRIDVDQQGTWREYAQGTSIGHRRLIRGKDITTTRLRLTILDAPACPAIEEVGLFYVK